MARRTCMCRRMVQRRGMRSVLGFGFRRKSRSGHSSISYIKYRVRRGVRRLSQASSVCGGRRDPSGKCHETIEQTSDSQNVILENALIQPGLAD